MSSSPHLFLRVQIPGEPPAFLELDNELRVGRGTENHFLLANPLVSKCHAVFERVGDGWQIRDLKSRNGIQVNGTAALLTRLSRGDRVLIGSAIFHVVRIGDEVQPVTTPPDDRWIRSHLNLRDPAGFLTAALIDDVSVLRRDYEKLRVAHQVSMMLVRERDVDRFLEQVLARTFEVIPADHGAALLVDPATGAVEPRMLRSREGPPAKVPISRSVVDRVLKTGDALLVDDVMGVDGLAGALSICEASMRAVMAVPLVVKEQVRGMLIFDNRTRAGAFEERDLHLLAGIAAQASLALERLDLLSEVEREAEQRAFLSRFLSPALVDQVSNGRITLSQAGARCPIAVIYADLRGFTTFSERVGPEIVVGLLNQYFDRMSDVVFQHDGVIDKFVGDAVMAIFGAPVHQADDVARAIRCAQAMQIAMVRLREERTALGLETLPMGIGLNAGDAVVGCVGSARRMDWTAIGDTINVAARLSGIAGPGEVLSTTDAMALAGDGFRVQVVEERKVKGRDRAITIVRVLP